MIAHARILLSGHFWKSQFSLTVFLRSVFTAVGVLVAGIEAVNSLASLFLPGSISLPRWIQANHWSTIGLVVVLAILVALAMLAPTIRVSSRLEERDLTISVELGNLFDTHDALVIGTNSTFDTDFEGGLISARSIQGQFTTRCYSSFRDLDAELGTQLQGEPYELLPRNTKPIGKRRRYRMGAVVTVNPPTRAAYLVAMSHMNAHGVASCSMEDLRVSLGSLWQFIAERGSGLPRLRVPVLGTGFGRLPAPRQVVIKEILRSLVAASAAARFCESVTVVVSVDDYLEHRIDLVEVGNFLRYLTAYTELRSAAEVGKGVAIG